MSIFGKKGGGLAGSLLGFAFAALFPPAAGLTLGYLATSLSIGFTVGNLLFPPEPEDIEQDLPTAPTVKEGAPFPVIVGKHIVRGGTVLYFNPEKLKSIQKGDFDKLLWAPMQLGICMCEVAPLNELFPSLGVDQQDKVAPDGSTPLRISAVDSNGDKEKFFMYFIEKVGSGLANEISATDSFLEIQSIIEKYQGLDPFGQWGDTTNADLSVEIFTKSFPQISWGGNPLDFYSVFEDASWAPNVNTNGEGSEAPGESFSGFWDEDLPPLKGVLTLASPVWPLGKNTSTIPNTSFLVEGIYTSVPGDFYLQVLVNDFFGLGLSPSKVNALTFSGAFSALVFFNATEGVSFNSNQSSSVSPATWIDKMNFHLDTILRKDHKGRLELVPERSLFDGPTYTQAEYEAWLDSGALESGDAGWVQANQQYFPGYPVVFDVYDGDHAGLTISDQQWSKTYNRFYASYLDANANYKRTTIPLKNESSFSDLGFWSEKSYQFDMFTDPDSVMSVMVRKGKKASRPSSIARFTLSKKFHTIRVGDGVRLWSKEHNLLGTYFRVRSVDDSRLGVNEISVEASLDLESLYSSNLLTVSNEIPQTGTEPSTPDDPDDPLALSAHPDLWNSNLAFADASSAGPNAFLTHVYAAKGQSNQSAFRYFATEGVLNPYVDVPIPQTAKGTVVDSSFGYVYSLVTPISADWYDCCLDDSPILLELMGNRGAGLESESWFGTKTDYELETSYVCLVLAGRATDNPLSQASDNRTEVLRFKKIEKVSGSTYKLSNVVRGANKEAPVSWPVGTMAWICSLAEPVKDASLPYDLWGNRSLAQYKDLALVENGSHRVRCFAQSISALAQSNDEELSETGQAPDDGLSVTYDTLNSQFFQSDRYIRAAIPPMAPAAVVRIGDVVNDNGLWFKIPTPAGNLLSAPYDFSSWSISGSVAFTQDQGGLGYAPGNTSLMSLRDLDSLNASVLTHTTAAASLVASSIYCLAIQVRNTDSDRSKIVFRSDLTNIAACQIDWTTDTFIDASSGSGTAIGYKISDDVWRVFLTAPTSASPGDLLVQLTINDSDPFATSEILAGETVVLNQATEPMYEENDWIVQFQPHGSYGGIGDKSIVPGTNTLWGDFSSDVDEDSLSTISDAAGSYRVDARITVAGSDPILKGQDSVVISSGDKWPSLRVKHSDLLLAGLSETPSASTEWHPKQLKFYVSKLGADAATYCVESEAEKKGPWTRTMRLF